MGAGRKVEACDTRKVSVPPSISASHRPGSGLRRSSRCTRRQADARADCSPREGRRWIPGVPQLQGPPTLIPTRVWELLLPGTSPQRMQPQAPRGAGAVSRYQRNPMGQRRSPFAKLQHNEQGDVVRALRALINPNGPGQPHLGPPTHTLPVAQQLYLSSAQGI